jgi:hypothetical protein
MPGAVIEPGGCRFFVPPAVPARAPDLLAVADPDGTVRLSWPCSAATIGLDATVWRGGQAAFALGDKPLAATPLATAEDREAPAGRQWYALTLGRGGQASAPSYVAVDVPQPSPPPAPRGLTAAPALNGVRLTWPAAEQPLAGWVIDRFDADGNPRRLTPQPLRATTFTDGGLSGAGERRYVLRAVSRRGLESPPSAPASAAPKILTGPAFEAPFATDLNAKLYDGTILPGRLTGGAKVVAGALDLTAGGCVAWPHRPEFDLDGPLTVELEVRLGPGCGSMPVLVSCGRWRESGWFLQRIGAGWRWHVAGIDCDGGAPRDGWTRLRCGWDGRTARLWQDGVKVGEATGTPLAARWAGDLVVGQYSGGVGAEYQVGGGIRGVRIWLLSGIDTPSAAPQ